MNDDEASGAFVSTGRIYDELLKVKELVAVVVDRDQREELPRRVRSLERWRAAMPATVFMSISSTVAAVVAVVKGH
jgi:hypothetical protein